MASEQSTATAVTVNFMNGDKIALALSAEATVDSLIQEVAAARNVPPQKVKLSAGTVVLPCHQPALTFGTTFTATICDTLGVSWKSVLEPSSATWAPLYNFTAVSYNGCVLVIGGLQADCNWGRTFSKCQNEIWTIDGQHWERLPAVPWKGRCSLAACVDSQDRLLIFGGKDEHGTVLRDAWAYRDSKWTQLPDGPWHRTVPDCAVARRHVAMVLAGRQLLELGDQWSVVSQMPGTKRATSCTVIGDDLYVGTYDSSVLIFRNGLWLPVQVQPQPKSFYSLVCAGPSSSQLYIYFQTAEPHGAGTMYICDAEEPIETSGSSCTTLLTQGVVPRFDDVREFHSRFFLLPIWGGLGILTCWGHLMHSV